MNSNEKELDKILDRVLITALFSRFNQEDRKKILASAHNLIDQLDCIDTADMLYNEQERLVELLRERLTLRLPESLDWSREYLLQNY